MPIRWGNGGYLCRSSGKPNLAVKASVITSVMVIPFRLDSAAQCLRHDSGTLQHRFTSRSTVGSVGLVVWLSGFISFGFTASLAIWSSGFMGLYFNDN